MATSGIGCPVAAANPSTGAPPASAADRRKRHGMMAGVATWEYRYGTGLSGMLDEMRASLSALGSVGWEVCGFASMDKTVGFNEYVVWLKRETLALTAPADTTPGVA